MKSAVLAERLVSGASLGASNERGYEVTSSITYVFFEKDEVVL